MNLEKFKKPNIELTKEQWAICWATNKEACSLENFAACLMMGLFDNKELYMKNCHGKSGKGKIPDVYLDTVLYACHTFYGKEMDDDSEKSWKKCTKAIDKRLRNSYGKAAERYKGAKLQI